MKRLVLFTTGLLFLILILFAVLIVPKKTIPILMYHSISSEGGRETDGIIFSPDMFEKQMQYLADSHYQVVSLEEVSRLVRSGKKIPPHWIALTFDDGHRDFYTRVYPILKKHGFHASIFVVINWIGRLESNLNWNHLRRLVKDNLISIGSHTVSHKLLPLLTPQEAQEEILRSKLILEEKLKKPVVSFCYPAGALSEGIKEMVKEAGYEHAVGTAYARGEFKDNDVYVFRRVVVTKSSKIPLVFRLMISGYYTPTRELILKLLNIKTPRALYS